MSSSVAALARPWIVVATGAALSVAVLGVGASAEGHDAYPSRSASDALRPNIIWVMADDLGWGEVGLYPSSSKAGRIATPNLDTFGREGVVFTNAYAGYTVCAPSRTAFFTGLHSGRFSQRGLNGKQIQTGQAVTNVALVLQSAGYTTGAFGKVAPLTSPLQQGFDAFIGQIDQAFCHNMYPKLIDEGHRQLSYNLTGNWRRRSRDACMAHPEKYNYTVDVFHEAGMQWLESASKGRRPFFLYLSYTIPHAGGWGDAPLSPEDGNPVPTDLQYADKDWPNVEKDHAAVISYLDLKIGDLLRRLKELGVDRETLVMFASDNGAHQEGHHSVSFFNSTGGLRGQKRSLYEGGVRSPTMARWPAQIPPGQISPVQWAFWDVLPTFAELAGAPTPAKLDGVSVVPALLGTAAERWQPHAYLFFTWGTEDGLGYGMRAGRWKGVVQRCNENKHPTLGDVVELYDLNADPFETTDVAHTHGDVVEKLKALVVPQNHSCMCYQCTLDSSLDGAAVFV